MYLCTFTGRPSVAESMVRDSINWGQGERSHDQEPYCPNDICWPPTCFGAWETICVSGPFQVAPSECIFGGQIGDSPLHKEEKSPSLLPEWPLFRAVALFLWPGDRMYRYRCRKYYTMSSTASPTSELSSKARLPYAWSTGYEVFVRVSDT